MNLPYHPNAHIQPAKLRHYLLSETHEQVAGKANFLRLMGFNESNIHALEAALLAIAQTEEVIKVTDTPYGVKYTIYGTMAAPVGKIVRMVTVWMIDEGSINPRFITAYPLN